MPDAGDDRLIKAADAAERLSVSPRTITNLAAQGKLARVKIGAATRYRSSEVDFLVKHGTGGADTSWRED